jgi:SAM-dependent methyltransferase
MRCPCCGSSDMSTQPVLWPGLVSEWGIDEVEAAYIDRQQGLMCKGCGSNLRSMTLAHAIMRYFSYTGLFTEFVASQTARTLAVLEINEAGMLTQFLQRMPHHTIVRYPESDMTRLQFGDASFDLVAHSDTLEHVADPVLGLSQCRRVLKPGGACAFTVPIIVGRLTRSRQGLPPSYHGVPTDNSGDYLVHTEYGADAWRHVLMAGFAECRVSALEQPSAHALVAVRD